jgi:hypothetical protein
MPDSRSYAEQACRFSQLSDAATSDEERELLLSIAVGYLGLAKSAADVAIRAFVEAERAAASA